MKFVSRYTRSTIRFRRWSRKSYAAFCSIGKIVTIGHVSAGIADVSLKKGKSMCVFRWHVPLCLLPGSDEGWSLDHDSPPWLYWFIAMPVTRLDAYIPSSKVTGRSLIAIRYGKIAEKCQSQCCAGSTEWDFAFQLF